MNAKEYFEKQRITDVISVIDEDKGLYNRFDVYAFAEEYHKAKLESLEFIDVINKEIKIKAIQQILNNNAFPTDNGGFIRDDTSGSKFNKIATDIVKLFTITQSAKYSYMKRAYAEGVYEGILREIHKADDDFIYSDLQYYMKGWD